MFLFKKVLPYLFVAILFLFAGYALSKPDAPQKNPEEKCDYKFLNPLRCEESVISSRTELVPLREKLEDYIEKSKKAGHIFSAAIYFRDMHNGPILNINELEKFTPASLLKVPIMITYLKLAESDLNLLNRKIGKDFVPGDSEDNTVGEQTIQPKTEYTIEELIYKMIVYSDNRSKDLLLSYLPQIENDYDPFLRTISDLGIVAGQDVDNDFISVKAYASIFPQFVQCQLLK